MHLLSSSGIFAHKDSSVHAPSIPPLFFPMTALLLKATQSKLLPSITCPSPCSTLLSSPSAASPEPPWLQFSPWTWISAHSSLAVCPMETTPQWLSHLKVLYPVESFQLPPRKTVGSTSLFKDPQSFSPVTDLNLVPKVILARCSKLRVALSSNT